MSRYVGAIDQGTSSSRFVLLDRDAHVVAFEQRAHATVNPRPGWVEQDALEIFQRVCETIDAAGVAAADVAAIGITNQRETTVLWDRTSGEPVCPAISWQDTRTDALVRSLGAADRLRALTGLPLSTYFSGPKIAWLLDSVPGLRERAQAGELAFGTIDSWLLWKLTGVHATDPSNASRTLLMDLSTLDWSDECLALMGIPRALLGEIRSSSEIYGAARATALAGCPVAALLGDQQAALFGQTCFAPGECKSTYGTGSFLLVNTGGEVVRSDALLSSVGWRLRDEVAYVLEGSIAVTGALVQWLRDRLGIIGSAAEVEELAASVPDTGGVYVVPAFSGLFAPHWRADARGTIVGLTAFTGRAHIARAALEAVAWQTRDVVDAVGAVLGAPLRELRVDGGMTANALLMQLQADLLGIPVVRPAIIETTALGAAFAAGLAVGFWSGLDELRSRWAPDRRWDPALDADERERRHAQWGRAVERSLGWAYS